MEVVLESGSHLDAVEAGCSQCEIEQCDGTVGYGGRYVCRMLSVLVYVVMYVPTLCGGKVVVCFVFVVRMKRAKLLWTP